MQGDSEHFGEYGPHLENWKERWGWDYENTSNTFEPIKENYINTLIHDYYYHDISKGPFKSIDLGEY